VIGQLRQFEALDLEETVFEFGAGSLAEPMKPDDGHAVDSGHGAALGDDLTAVDPLAKGQSVRMEQTGRSAAEAFVKFTMDLRAVRVGVEAKLESDVEGHVDGFPEVEVVAGHAIGLQMGQQAGAKVGVERQSAGAVDGDDHR